MCMYLPQTLLPDVGSADRHDDNQMPGKHQSNINRIAIKLPDVGSADRRDGNANQVAIKYPAGRGEHRPTWPHPAPNKEMKEDA